jgi:hypothetical protein
MEEDGVTFIVEDRDAAMMPGKGVTFRQTRTY